MLPLLMVLPGGCAPLGIGAAVTAGSVAAIGRSPVGAVVSVATGPDCSVVRLDRGQGYCRPEEAPPAPPPYCTRSLGRVDCWAAPLPGRRGVADGPATLSAA
jgi:hypothetical protein